MRSYQKNSPSSLLLFILGLSLFSMLGMSGAVCSDSFSGEVSRALFTLELKNNEPVNEVLILENNNKNLFFFSEVRNMNGKAIKHRWEFREKKMYEKKFIITKNNQKLISKFKLDPKKTGEWMVIVSDDKNLPVKAVIFKYVKQGSFAGKGIIPASQ